MTEENAVRDSAKGFPFAAVFAIINSGFYKQRKDFAPCKG